MPCFCRYNNLRPEQHLSQNTPSFLLLISSCHRFSLCLTIFELTIPRLFQKKWGRSVSSVVKLHRIVHHHGLQQCSGRAVHYHIVVFLNSFNKSARPEPDGKKTGQKAAGFHFFFCQEGGKVFLLFPRNFLVSLPYKHKEHPPSFYPANA